MESVRFASTHLRSSYAGVISGRESAYFHFATFRDGRPAAMDFSGPGSTAWSAPHGAFSRARRFPFQSTLWTAAGPKTCSTVVWLRSPMSSSVSPRKTAVRTRYGPTTSTGVVAETSVYAANGPDPAIDGCQNAVALWYSATMTVIAIFGPIRRIVEMPEEMTALSVVAS